MAKTMQRFGDGYLREMTENELWKDIEDGIQDAADRCGGSPLSDDETKHLFDIYLLPNGSLVSSRAMKFCSPTMAAPSSSMWESREEPDLDWTLDGGSVPRSTRGCWAPIPWTSVMLITASSRRKISWLMSSRRWSKQYYPPSSRSTTGRCPI